MILSTPRQRPDQVVLRKYPYPYKAAIAISNDCEFMSWKTQLGLYRFLCGDDGLGLEISNSLFFFVTNSLCHSTFSYFEGASDTASSYAPMIREMIRAGYIDTIHAYGDFDDGSFQRGFAQRIMEECARNELTFAVWTNHGSDQNLQNVGHRRLTNYQQGDNPHHPCYHLDLLRQMGVRYVWVDDGYVNQPYEETSLLYEEHARDGSFLTLFRRYRGLVGKPAPNASSLPEQILVDDLDSIIAQGRACVFYQHLGCWQKTEQGTFEANRPPFFTRKGFRVLEYLAEAFHDGRCLVSTVSRLLRYLEIRDSVVFSTSKDEVLVSSTTDGITGQDLAGVTVYVPEPDHVRLVWQAKDGARTVLPTQVFIEPDTQRACIGVPWKRLEGFLW